MTPYVFPKFPRLLVTCYNDFYIGLYLWFPSYCVSPHFRNWILDDLEFSPQCPSFFQMLCLLFFAIQGDVSHGQVRPSEAPWNEETSKRMKK